ncbi:hypothetical protein P8452_08988 [Trifolium repens]|jgi:hypothetical protein|nr:hypothetical protein QL285_052241 [Trifolium repens]WJX19275.1 hypothetical protein P8452_08988 [Trifolium repens]
MEISDSWVVDLGTKSIVWFRVRVSKDASPKVSKFIVHEFVFLYCSRNVWAIGYTHEFSYISMAIAVRDSKKPKSSKALMDKVSIVRGIFEELRNSRVRLG